MLNLTSLSHQWAVAQSHNSAFGASPDVSQPAYAKIAFGEGSGIE